MWSQSSYACVCIAALTGRVTTGASTYNTFPLHRLDVRAGATVSPTSPLLYTPCTAISDTDSAPVLLHRHFFSLPDNIMINRVAG